MNKYTFSGKLYGEELTITRINRTEARNRYLRGEKIFITACKMNPFNPWNTAMPMQLPAETPPFRGIIQPTPEESWNAMILEFSAYNCLPETGRYPAFYRPIM